MGLVRMTQEGKDKFLSPKGVTAVTEWEQDGRSCSRIWYGPVHGFVVDGTPRDVHAALFPPTHYEVPEEKQEALLAELRANARGAGVDRWVPVDMHEPAKRFRSELDEALDPATYAKEWQNYSPEKVRAMAWALTLVRARLGVGK